MFLKSVLQLQPMLLSMAPSIVLFSYFLTSYFQLYETGGEQWRNLQHSLILLRKHLMPLELLFTSILHTFPQNLLWYIRSSWKIYNQHAQCSEVSLIYLIFLYTLLDMWTIAIYFPWPFTSSLLTYLACIWVLFFSSSLDTSF